MGARFVTNIQEMLSVRVVSNTLTRGLYANNVLGINKVGKLCRLSSTGATPPHNPATERKMTALELQHLARKGIIVRAIRIAYC